MNQSVPCQQRKLIARDVSQKIHVNFLPLNAAKTKVPSRRKAKARMCRWISLMSSEKVVLSDIILHPTNSLIDLAKDASYHPGASNINNHVTNGDGFGVGWYHSNTPVAERQGADEDFIHGEKEMENYQAAVFKDTLPAWNNSNLREVSHAVRSHCIVAHVRAASRFAGISSQNCHPFKAGRILFCHNGRIPQFNKIRRKIMDQCSNEAYVHIKGTTDSEAIFGLILTYLARDEPNQQNPMRQRGPFGHKRLANAITKALGTLDRAIHEEDLHLTSFSTLNFCLTDGRTMVVTRFCDKSPEVPPPSLYFAYGDAQTVARELIVPPEDDDLETFPEQCPPPTTGNNHRRMNSNVDETVSSDDPSGENDNDGEDFDEKKVDLDERQSRSGTRFSDVDAKEATFLVASCPLTPTHTWHPMPQNSIIWYSLGSRPELRLLKKKAKKSILHDEPPIILEKLSLELIHPMPVAAPHAY